MFSTSLCLLMAGLATTAEPAYPRSDLLVEAGDLAGKPYRILDARSKDKYEAGHIPGAVWVDVAEWAKAFNTDTDAASWGRRIGGLGIGNDSVVVVYDDQKGNSAARVWWILKYWGIDKVRLLNGGWIAYQAAQGPVDKTASPPAAVAVRLTAQSQRLATKDQVLEALKKKDAQIVDARSKAEHCGDAKTAQRNGAIPGAVHLEWLELVDAQSQRFKPPAELARLFKEAGIDMARPAVTHCQSGGRAAVMAFALELMGAKEVRNYYKSWAEWGNDPDTPIVTPKK